ncbi:uncharacterized protein HD556DRAFT_1461166 [Suillus plorans]|uniref:Uncharacterized protein n=1 Tax=Suillus plorans TaxID=116603 RepID=A0A9P7A9A4_9AGAM|nr:uncharacterized protein HD556DRAFT_1461166 [Suillus plorans]KAG1784885.1 hypothetical protein HD556DRAFT_1461166 [Suillus plorans]
MHNYDSIACSVREVNAFTSAILLGLSVPQALAYWAAGIKWLVRSLAELGPEDSDLDLTQLSDRYRNIQENDLVKRLDTVKYEIDSKDSFKLFGSDRIKNFLLPVLYLITRRHLQIMKLARTVILVDREFECATQMISNILEVVDLRVEQLAESFRQQGTDAKARFTWYAHGLYNFWYSPERTADDTECWEAHDFELDNTELEIDKTALKLGPFSLTEDQELLERPVKLVAYTLNQQPEDPKDEYIRLWCLNKLHNKRKSFPLETSPYLSPEQQQRCCCDACHSLITDTAMMNANLYQFQNTNIHRTTRRRTTCLFSAWCSLIVAAAEFGGMLGISYLVFCPPQHHRKTYAKCNQMDLNFHIRQKPLEQMILSHLSICGEKAISPLPYAVIVHFTMCSTWPQITTLTNTGWSRLKDRVQDTGIETSVEPLANVDETTSLSLRVDKLAAMVESRFVGQDLRLSALVKQVEQLVHSIAALTGKAELPSESVTV